MKTTGLTGGIGTGKTTVAKIFASLGVPIFEADKVAKQLVHSDNILKRKIETLFGSDAYLPNGTYNAAFIAAQVYGNEPLLAKLNSLVHPAVAMYFQTWLQAHTAHAYIIREAAIIHADHGLHKVIVVTSPMELRLAHIQKRDPNRSKEQIQAIMDNQKTEEEYLAFADFVIQNDGQEFLIKQVLDIHKRLLANS